MRYFVVFISRGHERLCGSQYIDATGRGVSLLLRHWNLLYDHHLDRHFHLLLTHATRDRNNN